MLSFGSSLENKVTLVSSLRAQRQGAMFGAGNCANQIVPRLYLSDLATACDVDTLARLGITHVLSILDFAPDHLPKSITCMHVRLEDRFNVDILSHLPDTTEFIRSALAGRADARVLVHCMMGISRSATVVCAYLIAEHNMSAGDALTFTRSKRPIVRPNIGFERQLHEWEQRFAPPVQESTVGMNQLRDRLRRILDGNTQAQGAYSATGQKQLPRTTEVKS
ncbi:protein-tyrosine phosphatase-like protein [Vararia minispora EC-137]|uniref:Protein-tyrosine phosphatase-like protein n=1 Tax=Vararia minispora EC-137 TaxID=1314806 RepID=A0ACB8QUJ9_9AGAM|nr:protein-tyrosine phosphatase-like protein [Vararia minispora EC-137]